MLAALLDGYGGEVLFRPSSASRWMKCLGSVQLSLRAPKDTRRSYYALEGSAAHKVAETALKGERDLDEWSDRWVVPDESRSHERVMCDREMVDGVGLYLDEMAQRWRPGCEQHVERRLSLQPLDPDEPLYGQNAGTGDCVILDYERRRLTIGDLKYGRGVPVPGDSPQLKDYATMGMFSFDCPGGWAEVETVVVQPRLPNESDRVKSFVFDATRLTMDFTAELVAAMESALEPDPPLTPGDHCRWCPAKPICPALRDRALHIARDEFNLVPPAFTAASKLGPLPTEVFVGTHEEPKPAVQSRDTVVLPAPTALGNDEIATILAREPLWDTWLTGVKQEAVRRLNSGSTIPDWMLGQRSGNRRWKGEEQDTLAALRALGLNVGEVYGDPKLKTPAQVEKLLPKEKRGLIETLVERPLGEPTLMPAGKGRASALTGAAVLGPIAQD